MKTNPNDKVFALEIAEGLSKREYFAAIALNGYISAGSLGMPDAEALAKYAIDAADALINQLNQNK